MTDNYIVIDGKEYVLTERQTATIKESLALARNNPFERVGPGRLYYMPSMDGNVTQLCDNESTSDDNIYAACNAFNDKAFAERVALSQLLYRCLLKFAYDNKLEDAAPLCGPDAHDRYFVMFVRTGPTVGCMAASEIPCTVYFSTKDGAQRAIDEVVRPFLKAHSKVIGH